MRLGQLANAGGAQSSVVLEVPEMFVQVRGVIDETLNHVADATA